MERPTYFADILLPLPLPTTFTYCVPRELEGQLGFGQRVVVPFGNNKLYSGLVIEVHTRVPQFAHVKYIQDIIDTQPVITDLQWQLWDWIAHYYMATRGEVMAAALPSGLKLAGETKIVLHPLFNGDLSLLNEREVRVVEALTYRDKLSVSEIAKITEVQKVFPVIKNLVEKQVILTEEEIKRVYVPKKETFIVLTPQYQASQSDLLELISALPEKQSNLILAFLMLFEKEKIGGVPRQLLLETAGVSSSPLQTLIKKGVLMQEEREVSRLPQVEAERTVADIQLSPLQQQKLDEIKESWKHFSVVLLHGITGSGKTELYIKLMDEVLAQGKQVLYLLPEIALTTQIVERLRTYFGERVGVYHSRFNEQERVEIWNRVLSEGPDRFDLVLGARSSLLLPFRDLGLIVVDEEHDASYRQMDPAPRYHARDAAVMYAHFHQAKVLLGSATPSLESYYNVQIGKYGLVELLERYAESQLPEIWIQNMVLAKKQNQVEGVLSHFLIDLIREALEKKEQIILFQNRRGYSVRMLCNSCTTMPTCKYCDVTLTYHKKANLLKCHYCGYAIPVPESCPTCGSHDVEMKGFGTQLVEEQLQTLFPDATVARMDLDTTRNKNSYQRMIGEFERGAIDILVGTQMVTKGLDFDRVSLVGVLDADHLLSYPDFRAFERAFQTLSQVSGRAGRKEVPGKVVVQTHQPKHKALSYVVGNQYVEMYQQQIKERAEFKYPPIYRLIKITLKHANQELVDKGAAFLASLVRQQFQGVLGPESPLVSKIQNLHLKDIYIKMNKDGAVEHRKNRLNELITQFKTTQTFRSIQVVIYVDF